MSARDFVKRAVARAYSASADRLYDAVVVRRAFPLLGGDLEAHVLEQGRRAVDSAAGLAVLDMPVGTAHFTVTTAKAGPGLVVGADIAEGMVRRAQQAAREAGVKNLVAVQADAHHLPFATGSFGAVLCTNGLPVIPGLKETVAELARVLVTAGRLYVSAVTLPVGRALPPGAAARLPTFLASERDLTAALESAGFVVDSVTHRRLAMLFEATLGRV